MVMDRRQSERQRNDTEAKEAGKCRERKALIFLQLGALQRQRGHVHEAVLVHAYVDERAEGGDGVDDGFDFFAQAQFDLQHVQVLAAEQR